MKKPEPRPKLDLPPSPLDIILDRLSLVGVLLFVAVLAAAWKDLPERVPMHFGASGEPNGWGTKVSMLILPAVALVMHIGLGLLARLPHIYNYPGKVTPENAERLYPLGSSMMVWLKTEIVWLFTVLGWLTIRVALGQAHGLGPMMVYVALGVIYGTIGYFLVAMIRAAKARPTDGIA
jgi:uncharacterized membrane protein